VNTLIDTSVWIQHLQTPNKKLSQLLAENQVLVHPFIVGEIFIGHIRNREEVMTLLGYLPQIKTATELEVQELVQKHRLFGRGLGWIDCHLLASTLLQGSDLYSNDKALTKAFQDLATS
jgi:predicted nucleic acid-binding protein